MTDTADTPDGPDVEARAQDYVLGLATPEERAAIARDRLQHATLDQAILAWEERLGPLAATVAPVAPPPELWHRIDAALDGLTRGTRGTTTVRWQDGRWETVAPGVDRKWLTGTPEGEHSYLLRLAAGAVLPAHRHTRPEHCLVVSGTLTIGALSMGAGDFHWAPETEPHGTIRSASGALLYIRYGT
ncbi:MAG: cupin domain-containing protein [Alphaproteobacteria bacterium]|nr:cupin domain-containing protein [Alphaproteobacteria bacterium]